MRPIEIRGEVHDVDMLLRRGRALRGAAMRSLLAAGFRALRRCVVRPKAQPRVRPACSQ
jgi:hypothetical protein